MHQEFSTIETLLYYAQNTPGHLGKGIYLVGHVSDELAISLAQATGLQLTDYRITIDHSAIIHALRQHGQSMEVLRGQIPVTSDDIL